VTYPELLAQLFAARRAGMVFGLERVTAVLDALGRPDRRLGAVVHVGGTNGKGSTAAMVASMVAATGARVGVYSSPHLATLRERVVLAGELASEDALVAAAERVASVGGDALTFFEQVTAMALVAMADAGLDVAVLEVGLGGRLDATNAVAAPIAVVTGVALDHQDLLGDTLAAIAAEKAGIFKPGQRVVVGASGEPDAVPLLVAAAQAAGAAAITVVDDEGIARVPPLGLAGAHQRANAAAALAAVDHLEAIGSIRIPDEARRRGLAAARHPGRLETVAQAPRIVLDGAHNPHGARALALAITDMAERPRVLVLAASADKDVAGLVGALAPTVDVVVATRYDQPRAMAADDLAAIAAGQGAATETAPDVAAAIARGRELAGTGGVVIVAGSLFAVGEARVHLLDAAADPFVITDPAPPARSGK
jgi:dihydrofolate synthase / folylpolyglutamate synthase